MTKWAAGVPLRNGPFVFLDGHVFFFVYIFQNLSIFKRLNATKRQRQQIIKLSERPSPQSQRPSLLNLKT